MKNIDDYCRKYREKSISPSISLDVSQNGVLSESEKIEKNFYSVTIVEMIREIFTSFDDLIKNINHFLMRNIKSVVKKLSELEWETLFKEFFNNYFVSFTTSYDEGEFYSKELLKLKGEDSKLSSYLIKRKRIKNLIPILKDDTKNAYSPLKKLDENNIRYIKNLKENIMLKIEISLEKKIHQIQSQNCEKIKEKLDYIGEQINKKADTSFIAKNLDIMSTKLKMMKRELSNV